MGALAPDLRGFGRRAVDEDQLGRLIERGDPEAAFFRRDMCNVQNLKAGLLGYTYMGLQLHDLSVALDILQARPEVDPERLGCCGLSTGGMMTLFLTALDQRIKTATISGTLTSYRSYAFDIETTCGSQLPHGLFRWGDLAEVGCLIAPRPVCFESGAKDFGFLPDVAEREFERIKQCYEVAGVPDRAVFDAFPGDKNGARSCGRADDGGLPVVARARRARGRTRVDKQEPRPSHTETRVVSQTCVTCDELWPIHHGKWYTHKGIDFHRNVLIYPKGCSNHLVNVFYTRKGRS